MPYISRDIDPPHCSAGSWILIGNGPMLRHVYTSELCLLKYSGKKDLKEKHHDTVIYL
jgi:hypothetical protein